MNQGVGRMRSGGISVSPVCLFQALGATLPSPSPPSLPPLSHVSLIRKPEKPSDLSQYPEHHSVCRSLSLAAQVWSGLEGDRTATSTFDLAPVLATEGLILTSAAPQLLGATPSLS